MNFKETHEMLVNDHQLYHSEFQQDYMITIKAGVTLYGQYKQALREYYKRWRGLKGLYAERELLHVDIDELAYKIKEVGTDEFEWRRNEINLRKKELDMRELEFAIKETEREFQRFFSQAVALKEQIGELTPERRNELDRQMWLTKFKLQAALEIITTSRIRTNTLESIMALPKETRTHLLEDIKNTDQLIEWVEGYEEPALKELPSPPEDIEFLLEEHEKNLLGCDNDPLHKD